MAKGWTHAFRIDHDSVDANGLVLGNDHLAEAEPQVQALLRDVLGASEVEAALAGILSTDFQRDRLAKVLTDDRVVEEWRVGEALAEFYLVEYRRCYFPWPSGRDLRNPGTSSGGVDLVGFHIYSDEVRFAFGEVKTSREQAWPPSVVTGRHGLQQQLEGLRGNDDRKRWAIRYLAYHAVNKSWLEKFRQAWTEYANDEDRVVLCGALVHVSKPNYLDLQRRTIALGNGCPASTEICLTAIYIPESGLDQLAGQLVRVETS